ncbi:TraR/DksA family transcriptional regulator [Desulfogranum mediterraneum]|uniref:TraR/DksA family transcriptional regulator n=1 Tax=Desulfogranum mediterraneum TaxID=160661 RepID=UPI000408DAE7|nr:TraR/DksA C4-type zinc finger protein [Desulfogranum mediterraneum]
MQKQELQKFRQTLLGRRQELLAAQEANRECTQPVALDQSSVGRLSRMDAIQSQAMAQETSRRRGVELVRIEAALERMDEDEFGYCALCDEEIDLRRLSIDPANPFCVSCASKM